MRSPAELRAAYEAGATVEQLALDEGTYTGKIRKLLKEAGTEMRPAKQRVGTKKNNPTAETPTERPTGVHNIHQLGNHPRHGYRRRGRRL